MKTKEPVRFRETFFGRWIVVHPSNDDAAWSGSRWVSIDQNAFHYGGVQVSNFASIGEAADYAQAMGFRVHLGSPGKN